MPNQTNQKRILTIFQMLYEMSIGNFSSRIPDTTLQDEITNISNILNKIADQMVAITNKSGYIISRYHYQRIVQATFILNKELYIENFSVNIPAMLGYHAEELTKMHFTELIATSSKDLIDKLKEKENNDDHGYPTQHLTFKLANASVVPHPCTIVRLKSTKKILVNIIQTSIIDYRDHTTTSAIITSHKNAALIQKIHDYILENLDKPLPQIKELAKIFKSNKFALQDGFHHFFNTSIYHFYNEQRLLKAHNLLQNTDHRVKTIGYMTGFNDYATFYKAFKKRYGYVPSALYSEKNDKKE